MRIVFMGTPDYAAVTLEKIVSAGHNVSAVFSQPDKPVGRKKIIMPTPVKEKALELDIPVFQPATLRDETIVEQIKALEPDVIVVVAYGKILKENVLSIPKYGCVNGHASLLPKYRGSAPIQWSIINGEKVTGITTMLMDEGIDTGDILETVTVPIGDEETAEELFCRLSVVSADLMVSTLDKLEKGELIPIPQNGAEATYAPIIKKEMAFLDFNKLTADEVVNAVRGYYSWPCAYFFLEGKRIKVIKAKVSDKTEKKSGYIIKNDNELVISCKDNTSVSLVEISPEGKSKMTAKQFLCGKKPPIDTFVGADDD